jgi:hypothetical protein
MHVERSRGFLLALSLASLAGTAQASNSSYYAAPVSCSAGPYALQLPDSYEALRGIGKLREDRVLPGPVPGAAGGEQRELVFGGLRLTILRAKLDPASYQVLSAEVSARGWKIAGPFKVGALLPAHVGEVDTRRLRGRGVVEFIGEGKDVVRMRRSGRRISSITYLCNLP